MFRVLIGFIILALIVKLGIWLFRSPKFDKWCDDMSKGKLDIPESSKDTMKDITKNEDVLGKQSDTNIKEAEKLKNESENIQEFLKDRGVCDDKKKGGSK